MQGQMKSEQHSNMNKPKTEMEAVLQRTNEKLVMQVAELTYNLHLAHSQIEVMKEAQNQKNAKK